MYIHYDASQCKDDEEIVAVIAHELGHWKLNHTMYSFIAVQVCFKFYVLIMQIDYFLFYCCKFMLYSQA